MMDGSALRVTELAHEVGGDHRRAEVPLGEVARGGGHRPARGVVAQCKDGFAPGVDVARRQQQAGGARLQGFGNAAAIAANAQLQQYAGNPGVTSDRKSVV